MKNYRLYKEYIAFLIDNKKSAINKFQAIESQDMINVLETIQSTEYSTNLYCIHDIINHNESHDLNKYCIDMYSNQIITDIETILFDIKKQKTIIDYDNNHDIFNFELDYKRVLNYYSKLKRLFIAIDIIAFCKKFKLDDSQEIEIVISRIISNCDSMISDYKSYYLETLV